MAEKTAKPAIRFDRFTDAWEERKLGSFTMSYSGGTPSVGKPEYYGGSIPFIRSAEINSPATELYLSKAGLDSSSAKLVDIGDILYALYGATSGEVGRSRICGAINQAILAITPTDDDDPEFIAQWLRKQKSTIIKTYLQGGQGNLSGSIVKNLPVFKPSSSVEQISIGSFFADLDHQITLHQHEHDKTVNIKKALLEKMFPKAGEDKPEIRFSGFTEAWERRKFDLMFTPIPNNTLSRAALNSVDGYIMNIHYGDILIKYGNITDCKKDKIPFITDGDIADYRNQFLRNGDILIADAAEDETVGKCTEMAGIDGNAIVSGLHTVACRPMVQMAPYYLGYYMNSPSYHHQLLPLMQGIKVLSISRSNLANTIISYPVSEEEQRHIGNTFILLDRLLTLHQRELLKLQNMKKSLLEKMFV